MNYFLLSVMIFGVAGLGMLFLGRFRKLCDTLFLLSLISACGFGLASGILVLWSGHTFQVRLPWNVPLGEFWIGLDAVSAFFLIAVMILSLATGLFGYGYLRDSKQNKKISVHYFLFYLLILTNLMIIAAKNAVLFLMAWELMTVSSFFLVTFYDEREEVRKAGYLYLIATHICTFFLLVMFLLMGQLAGSMNFDQMKMVSYPPIVAGIIFLPAFYRNFQTHYGKLFPVVTTSRAQPAAALNDVLKVLPITELQREQLKSILK